MDINSTKTSSSDLLNCGNQRGFSEKLLLKPKPNGPPKTERVPRSSILDRLQSLLPQMAEANEKLQREMEETSAESFDIENVRDADRVIEMDVALFELGGSDSSEADSDSDEDEEEEEEEEDEGGVTENNMKLPGHNKTKAKIQVLKETEEST